MIRNPSHQFRSGSRESGSALLIALITMTVLTTIAASVFLSSVPAYRGTYQASAWQEAKLAADAGVDYAMAELQKTKPNPTLYAWPGWSIDPPGTISPRPVPVNYDGVRYYAPPTDTLGKGDGSSKPRIFRIEVDVLTRDTNFAQNAWFRIRSTGLAEVNSSQLSLDKRDQPLRRMTLRQNHITRTVEVLSRPTYLWEYALKTSGSMVLGGGLDWRIDSYDSRYPGQRSDAYGIYSAQYSREFGNIASDLRRPLIDPIGPLIDAEGAMVKGEVQTNGGDNPDTLVHENVADAEKIDPLRITDEYHETLSVWKDPTWYKGATTTPGVLPYTGGAPSGTNSFGEKVPLIKPTAGETATLNNPYKVIINANGGQAIGGFEVEKGSSGGANQFVDIYINGKVDLNGSSIQVQNGVHVNIYLNGDLNFRNMDINYLANTQQNKAKLDTGFYSMKPADLLIYGMKDPNASPAPRVDSSGNGHIVAAFYGPQYAGNLDGNTEILGSFVLKTYNIAGGGGSGGDSVGAGVHYDEALGVIGPVTGYKAVSYFEDTRKNIE